MTHRTYGLILILFFTLNAGGQEHSSFHPPLNIPMKLSGNFGEIRTDHFHSGIDIKTQGTIGHQVFSIDEGYVSRIKVQANGYGKSIYISHPNGYTSVYGHLDQYRDDIADYVKRMQYRRKSHTVDIYLDKTSFPLQKGEFIAFSGNSGSSSGPHLHFEIRTTANQHPTNVLSYEFDIKDKLAPRFHSLHLYPMDEKSWINGKVGRYSSKLARDKANYTIPYGTSIEGAGSLGLSVEVFDYLDGAINRCGIYTLQMYVDDKLTYSHVMDEFSFSQTRYINAHIDYEERIRTGKKAHRLHRLPNDRLAIYGQTSANKALLIEESRNYQIRIEATDVAGNKSTLAFTLKGNPEQASVDIPETDHITNMRYAQANSYKSDRVKLSIPANSLYQDLDFSFQSHPPTPESLTPFYEIASDKIPVHKAYTLSIKSPDMDPSLHKRLLLISRNSRGEIVSAGGEYKEGWVQAHPRKFGEYAVGLDTVAPRIIPLQSSKGDYSGKKFLRFTISDDLSGIGQYEGYIDNQWALFEYDPKNALLFYSFDEDRISKESEHELELYVSDNKGNVNLFQTTFQW